MQEERFIVVPFEKQYQKDCVEIFIDGLEKQGSSPTILQLQAWFVKQKTGVDGDMHDIWKSYMAKDDDASKEEGVYFFVALDTNDNNRCVG